MCETEIITIRPLNLRLLVLAIDNLAQSHKQMLAIIELETFRVGASGFEDSTNDGEPFSTFILRSVCHIADEADTVSVMSCKSFVTSTTNFQSPGIFHSLGMVHHSCKVGTNRFPSMIALYSEFLAAQHVSLPLLFVSVHL